MISLTGWKDTSCIEGIDLNQNSLDIQDFETNYLNTGKVNLPIHNLIVQPGTTTYFTGIGDSGSVIGEGKDLMWDFSTSDDEVSAPTGFKRKRLDFSFLDEVSIRDGIISYSNKLFKSYIDLYIICPEGSWYLDNAGNSVQASEDTIILHYVSHKHLFGTVSAGDRLDPDRCSNKIPTNYKFRIEITVPSSDNSSNGSVALKIFRDRTVIL